MAAAVPAATSWKGPLAVSGGFAATLAAALGMGEGWRRSHRQKRQSEADARHLRQAVLGLEAEKRVLEARLAEKALTETRLRDALNAATEKLHALEAKSADAVRWRAWAQENDVKNTDNQGRFIAAAALKTKRLLNREERAVYRACIQFVRGTRLKVCPQASMGEAIAAEAEDQAAADNAHASYNSKRIDLLICDEDWLPLVAIEHQGSGHYQGNAEARDRVKRLALERAGIGLVETCQHMERDDVVALLEAEVRRVRTLRADAA